MAGTVTIPGARIQAIINAKVLAIVQTANYSIEYGIKPIYEIDNINPRELAPGNNMVNFTLQGVTVLSQNFAEKLLLVYNKVSKKFI